jgi:1-acyl-sn-glycerol-3-phosphate acyltransferase
VAWLSWRITTFLGWIFPGELPDEPKMVVIGAPHTSNWDFFLFLAALHRHRIRARFLGKAGLFRWPLGPVLRAFGGIPVDGGKPGGVVSQAAAAFAREDRMILVIAPEGTRAAAPHWRSGFYEIARRAGVPVVLAGIDARGKRLVIGPALGPTTAKSALMDTARVFYREMNGLRPALDGPVRLEDEADIS